jgi:polyhydroxyalkanoate synthesis regulator phasin
MVVTEVRKYMEAAVEKLTPARAQEMAKSLMQGQAKGKEQVQKVAQDLMDWSNQTRERMAEMVRREVARQVKSMGVASKDDLEDLKRRVRQLERESGRARAVTRTRSTAASTTKSAAKKRAVAKKPAAGRTSSEASDKAGS